jgi:uncharacterized protein YbbK (DUF523 family)
MNYEVVLVSACLLGVNCRHDGGHAYCPEVVDDLFHRHFIPACPEQWGGLPTPRIPASIQGGDGREVWQGIARVINKAGEDVTAALLKGAKEVLSVAQMAKVTRAILKDHSPSCGCQAIYRGGELAAGAGVTAVLLAGNGIEVLSELGEPLFIDRRQKDK